MKTPRLAYTVAEAADLLSVSRSRLYEMIQSGQVGSVKFGRSRRITSEQLCAFLRRHEDPSPVQSPNEARGKD